MADYISREDALAVIDKIEDADETELVYARLELEDLPSADVVDREAYNQMVDLALRQRTIVNKIKELVGARNG